MAAVGSALAGWVFEQLAGYAGEVIKPAVKQQLGLQVDSILLRQIKQELDDVKRGQEVINKKLDTITAELRLGFKLQQFITAESKIRSRMVSFGDAMELALAEQQGKKLSDHKGLQSVITAIGVEIDGIREQLRFVQDALLSRENPQGESLIDVINGYFWNKYGGAHGLSAPGINYGIPSYVKDIQAYFQSIANLQLTAIYLISWAVDPAVLRVDANRTRLLLEEQAQAIRDFIPAAIDITDTTGKGDAFFRQVKGKDDCFMIREAFGEKKYLTSRRATGLAQPNWYVVGSAPWKGNLMAPMDYKWMLEPVDDVEGYKLIGWDVNSPIDPWDKASLQQPRTVQWEKDAHLSNAGRRNRYTTRNKGQDVVFKIIVVRTTGSSKYTTIRLVDKELARSSDGNTPTGWDNRLEEADPWTYEVEYQKGQRYNTVFDDSSPGFAMVARSIAAASFASVGANLTLGG